MADNNKFNIQLEQYMLNENSNNIKDMELNKISLEYIRRAEEDNLEFFKRFDIKKLSKETEKKSNLNKTFKFPKKVITGLAAAACLIITLNFIPDNFNKEIIYLKGSQKLNIYLKEKNNVNKLNNMDKVFKDDQLQITYTTKDNYGIIFSIDGLNNITYHYPEDMHSSTDLEIGKEVTLPTSYTLDNAPHFEKFYMITSEDSFQIDLVKTAISNMEIKNGQIIRDLILPSKYRIDTTILVKE